MIDENAFGFLISYFDVEDDEYALERDEFVARFTLFRRTIVECLDAIPLGRGVRAMDIGHAVYAEVAEGDQSEDPLSWIKMVRARLSGRGFSTVGVLTHGSRWEVEGAVPFSTEFAGDVALTSVSRPSEPLRRALSADAAAREEEAEGWGPGLYLDTEAVEALGRTPKNAPTLLRASGGAEFYRAGR